MANYIDSAQDCFQSAQNDPWHSPANGRSFDYHLLSLTLHYARLSLDKNALYLPRGHIDEDTIARSSEWWFYDLNEADNVALTSAGISIDDFMRTKHQHDIRACFPYFCDIPDRPANIGGFWSAPEALDTFKSSLEDVIDENVTLDLVERAHKERWYSDGTLAFENAKSYYKSFCETLLGITAINKLGGTESCGVPQAAHLTKMNGVPLLRRTLRGGLRDISPDHWGEAIGIPPEKWSAADIDPLWTKAVLTPGQWTVIALTPCPPLAEKYSVSSGFSIFSIE